MADGSQGRRRVRLLLAALAGIAFAAALRLSRVPHPAPPGPDAPPVIAHLRSQLALGPVLAAEAALQRSPDDPQTNLRLADACAAAGDPVGAALAIYPLVAEGVGRPVSGVGRRVSGVRSESARHPTPDTRHPDLSLRYARLCVEIGWLDEADAVLRRLPAVRPGAWVELASAFAEHGQADRATALLQSLTQEELGPEEWLEGAICWYHCRRGEQAVQWAQKAGGTAPSGGGHSQGRTEPTGRATQGSRSTASRLPAPGARASTAARGVLARCLLVEGRPEAALEALLTDAGDAGQGRSPDATPSRTASPSPSENDGTMEFWRGRAEVRCASEALRTAGRERLARLAAADPANGAAAFEAGLAFLRAGEPQRAVEFLSQAAVSGYQEALCYERLAEAYGALGHRSEALWARARGDTARGRFHEAATALRHSVKLDPSRPLAWVDLARALHAEGKVQEAVAVLQQAQKLAPGNMDLSLMKAQMLLHLERVPDVVRELEAAAALDPRRANEPLGNLGTVYFDSQQFDRAIAPLERAVQLEDADAHSHFYLGRTYARELEEPGRAEKAVAHLLRAAQLQPDYSRPWMGTASVLQRMSYLSEAAACLRRAIAGECQSDASYVRLGQLLQRQGRLPERRLILRLYGFVRDHDLRRTGLEKKTRDNPRDAEQRYALGELLLREGRPEKALPELLVAAELRPGWQQAQVRLADACALLGYDDMREEAEGAARQ